MKTTLNKIRAHSPCARGWEKLLKNLGKTKADNVPLALTTILESNGIDDALWCLRAVDGREREMRLYAIDCARSVQHLMTDKRSLGALDVAERFANGLATQAELATARATARTTARATARDAAWATARDAARAAARDAARGAAWGAAGDAAGDAAWAAAWAAARDAARAAAWAAARGATWGAAWGAAGDAAGDAAWAAAWAAAWGAAWGAARGAQANLFVLMCEGCYE